MTGPLLALASAVCFGIADYAGGLLSRRANPAAVALAVQVSGCAVMVAVAPVVPAPGLDGSDLAWGALSGVGTATGVGFLYRGLTRGHMSVVVPLSAVGGLALPVLVGVTIMAESPSMLTWLGIALAVPAVALVARKNGGAAAAGAGGVLDGLVASMGFALQYIALAQAGTAAGLWPVAAGRLASVPTVMLALGITATRLHLPRGVAVGATANGVVAVGGLALYLLATRQELVTVSVVLSSLYPAIPVLLGITVLGERLTRQQTIGLVGAGLTIALLTAG
ncbi:MAG TPA: DMT family transporter [Nocardioidaceae bacterium]|nr:DMT family transporter [Nocardioidaceae bacterium]